LLNRFDAGAVMDVEAFADLAVRPEVQATVGEHAVHIQDQQANLPDPLSYVGHAT
jgi:hypothetical protein